MNAQRHRAIPSLRGRAVSELDAAVYAAILKILYGILRTMLQVGCWPGVSALVNDAVLRPGPAWRPYGSLVYQSGFSQVITMFCAGSTSSLGRPFA